MNHELIDRYIYAVTRRLSQKLRGDVEKELGSLISDMLEARCGAVAPGEKDIRIVLTELGAPDKLAAKYSGDEGRALIGGEYFLMYKFVLKLVLPIAAAGIAFASVLALILDGGPATPIEILAAILRPIGSAFAGAIQAFAIVTLIFAVFEWKKVKLNGGDFLDTLPPVPVKNEIIKPGEPIAGMVLCAVMALVFLVFPQVIAAGVFLDGIGWTSAFDVPLLRSFWLPIALWAALGIGKEIVRLIEGRYTRRLAIVSAAANPVIAVCAVVAFGSNQIMNPVFLRHMGEIFGETGRVALAAIENAHLIFLGVVMFALVLETVTFWVKARKYNR